MLGNKVRCLGKCLLNESRIWFRGRGWLRVIEKFLKLKQRENEMEV